MSAMVAFCWCNERCASQLMIAPKCSAIAFYKKKAACLFLSEMAGCLIAVSPPCPVKESYLLGLTFRDARR